MTEDGAFVDIGYSRERQTARPPPPARAPVEPRARVLELEALLAVKDTALVAVEALLSRLANPSSDWVGAVELVDAAAAARQKVRLALEINALEERFDGPPLPPARVK